MNKQKIHCAVIDQDVGVTASLDVAFNASELLLEVNRIPSLKHVKPLLAEYRPQILFCPYIQADDSMGLLENLQRYSPDTLLVWVSQDKWQGLTTWLIGVESCILPLNDMEYFNQYLDFLLRYCTVKQDFRQCKHLLGIAELRCHWLVDYSWEAIAYISQGMHLYANHAYVNLLGFESMAEVRSMPVSQLIDAGERPAFEMMSRKANTENSPSDRLLTTLRTLNREDIRAEIRFIPAVLKGKRCLQFHVRPLDKHVRMNTLLRDQDNPWERSRKRIQSAPAPNSDPVAVGKGRQMTTETVASPGLDGMEPVFNKLVRLQQNLPELYVAEPVFQQQPAGRVPYGKLIKKLASPSSRFRLDYWNMGQTVKRLSSGPDADSGYLIFVPVGAAIFNNEGQLRDLLELLNASGKASRRIVVGLHYRDCLTQAKKLGKLTKLFKAVGVRVAIDGLSPGIRAVQLLQHFKPVLARLDPEKAARALRDKTAAHHLYEFAYRLNENKIRVIASGVGNATALKLMRPVSAYIQRGDPEPSD